jgi:hypothetical protein
MWWHSEFGPPNSTQRSFAFEPERLNIEAQAFNAYQSGKPEHKASIDWMLS